MIQLRYWRFITLICCVIGISPFASAQNDCGVVDNITYPIDTATWDLAQDFAVASPRHQGRFHTGEDWYAGRNVTQGQPVRAAAKGRVVYSFVRGWGRDGGVVIIEHTMPDGEIVYTQYGHITENETVTFPPRLSCVQQGEALGVVADARPAPHLHFEVRVANPDTPGPGYTRPEPYDEGFRDPGKFIANNRAWLNLAHQWHISTGTESPIDETGPRTPPLVLSDNSLLYLDGAGTTLRRATSDGRVLWRLRLEKPAVYLEGFQGAPLLVFADGTHQYVVNIETGGLGEASWQLDADLLSAPVALGELLLYPAANDTLVAVDGTRREIAWRVQGVRPYVRVHVATDGLNTMLGWLTADNELLTLSSSGELLDRAQLQASPALATAPDGTLLVYSLGGLWQVNRAGDWSLFHEDLRAQNESSAILQVAELLFLFDGVQMQAYSGGNLLWSATPPPVSGRARLTLQDELLLLTTNHGDIILMGQSGTICNFTEVYGSDAARQWVTLGTDGTLRLAIADQILGLEWGRFAATCT